MQPVAFWLVLVMLRTMDNFVAIDFETANYNPSSICSIGAVKVIDGCIADRIHRFVRPEPNWYLRYFTEEIHGISRRDTDSAPVFSEVWGEIEPWIGTLPLVAHNKAFDEKCLRTACRVYGIDYPDYEFHCTLQGARRVIPRSMLSSYSLPYVCEFMGITFFNHHDALADAEACAKIAMAIL